MAGNRKLAYLHETLANLTVADHIMPDDLRGVSNLYWLLEADPKQLDTRQYGLQTTLRQTLGYPTEHPTADELELYLGIELRRARREDNKRKKQLDTALRSVLPQP